MNGVARDLRDAVRDLSWSLWGELGVSTWQRAHDGWAVELEPLIAFTAFVAPDDRRLLRESVDWCVRHERFISLHQLRHVVTSQRWPFEGDIARFGATVATHTKRKWPGIAREGPYEVALSGRSKLPDLAEPSLLQLRLRALLGVSGRAEIVRALVLRPAQTWTVTSIADRIAYSRRQVSLDLEMLELGGFVRRSNEAGPATYLLADPSAVVRLIGRLPDIAPRWAPLLRSVLGLVSAAEAIGERTLRAPGAELSRQLRLLGPELRAASLRPPGPGGADDVEAFQDWTRTFVTALAAGSHEILPGAMTAPV